MRPEYLDASAYFAEVLHGYLYISFASLIFGAGYSLDFVDALLTDRLIYVPFDFFSAFAEKTALLMCFQDDAILLSEYLDRVPALDVEIVA